MPVKNSQKNADSFSVSGSSPTFTIAPRRLRIPDAAKYIASTNWFMEDLLRENQLPFQWCGKYKVVDVRDFDAWVDRDRKRQMQSARTVEAA